MPESEARCEIVSVSALAMVWPVGSRLIRPGMVLLPAKPDSVGLSWAT